MKYFLACNLRGDISTYQKKLVRDIAENFGVILPTKQKLGPHVTLKYSFEAPNIKQLEEMIQNFCASHRKSKMMVGRFNNFRNDVIFLDIELSDEAKKVFLDLIDVLRKLQWMSWGEYDGEILHFHSTIASGCEKNYTEIFPIYQREKFSI